mmetsp:Transcript_13945/g.28667  ORF Transcript_13945/g.28667 Transcript_13945/m.28667 type:complete len:92 (+) Transcript_13945:403-678(+)
MPLRRKGDVVPNKLHFHQQMSGWWFPFEEERLLHHKRSDNFLLIFQTVSGREVVGQFNGCAEVLACGSAGSFVVTSLIRNTSKTITSNALS